MCSQKKKIRDRCDVEVDDPRSSALIAFELSISHTTVAKILKNTTLRLSTSSRKIIAPLKCGAIS